MTPPSARGPRAIVAALGLAVAVAALQMPTAAQAAPTPAKPAGVRVVAVSGGGFTVALRSSRDAVQYRVWATTTKSRLALRTIGRTSSSRVARSPRVTVTGLRYTAAPYYYRVQAIGRGTSRYSDVHSTRLRASTPTGLRVSSSRAGGTSLTWGGRAAARYVVQAGPSAAMDRGLRTWTTRSVAQQLTPVGLTPGTRYWFRVRAENGSVSAWSRPVSAVAAARGLPVRVLTYNVLRADRQGTRYAGGERVGTWAQRGPAVLREIRRSHASVVALQEAASWTNKDPRSNGAGVRQADWLQERLGGRWTLASTEKKPGDRGWKRTGRYLLFDGTAYTQRAAGTWTLVGGGNPTHVAYAVLQHRATGARFVATSAHLYPSPGSANDRRRRLETQRLVAQVDALRRAEGGIPAFYAGDMNSAPDVKHPLDGPGVTFRAHRVTNTGQASGTPAPTARFNSANQLLRRPPAKAVHVDGIWATPGVGVRGWAMMLTLGGGRFTGTIASDHNAVMADLVLPY